MNLQSEGGTEDCADDGSEEGDGSEEEGCTADTNEDGVCDCEDADADGRCDYCEDADSDGQCDCDEVDDNGDCVCEDADGDGECDPPGVEIDTATTDYYIEPSERMPSIEFHARLKNADAFLRSADIKFKDVRFEWRLEMAYDDGNFSSEYSIPRGATKWHPVVGRATWRPDWGTLVSGAKTMTVKVKVGNGEPESVDEDTQTGYRIKGRNPTKAQIAAQASSPWYFTRLVRAESSCLQFSDGYPRKSWDNGYGLMQITNPPPEEADLWQWTHNIRSGRALLEEKTSWAASHWRRIKMQWEDYNRRENPGVPAPPNKTYSGITFGYSTGYPLSDGLAIKYYNGNGCGKDAPAGCTTGPWLNWITTTDPPQWEFNEGRGYIAYLARQTPCE